MNNVVAHRSTALTEADFNKLDQLASEVIGFSEREFFDLAWDKDEYGDPVQRRVNEYTLPAVYLRAGEIDRRLAESLLRPCSETVIGKHLLRLSCHKVWTRGLEAWQVVTSDLCRDLEGVSEYAIVKVCEHYRSQVTTTYFPDTAALVARIRALDAELRNAAQPHRKVPQKLASTANLSPERERPTAREIHRVRLTSKIGHMPAALRTKWQQRWWEARLRDLALREAYDKLL